MNPVMMPPSIADYYEIHNWKHATAILANDFPDEWAEIIQILGNFRLLRSAILTPGGRKSPISNAIENAFNDLGWRKKAFDTRILLDDIHLETPTHNIDCFKVVCSLSARGLDAVGR